jgi:hypothetical protein
MKKLLIGFLAFVSFSAFAKPVCSRGLIAKYVCTTNDTEDGIYRLISGDITICQWGNKAEVVTIEKNGDRESLPATIKSDSKKDVYSIKSEGEIIAKLTINKQTGSSTLKITNDWEEQKRTCKPVR